MNYLYLTGAVICEVIGTMLLPASKNFTKLYPTLGLTVAYMLAFYQLTLTLRTLPIAVVYASWSGLGIFLIAIFGYVFLGQTLVWQSVFGLVLIVMGVTLVNVYIQPH